MEVIMILRTVMLLLLATEMLSWLEADEFVLHTVSITRCVLMGIATSLIFQKGYKALGIVMAV